MKYCISCGAQLDDNAVYCSLCGSKQAAVVPPPSYQTPVDPGFTPSPLSTSTAHSNPSVSARSLLYKHGASANYLTAIILYTISCVISMLSVFVSANYLILSFIENETDTYFYEKYMTELISPLQNITNWIIVIICVPIVLNMIGVWLFRASCRKQSSSTKGLTIIRGVTISMVVLSSIGIISAVLSAILLLALGNSDSSVIIVYIFLAFLCVLPLLFNISVMKIIKNMQITILTDSPFSISSFIPVMLILSAVMQGFILILNFSFPTLILFGIALAPNIVLAICIYSFNSDIQTLIMRNNVSANQQTHTNGL